jgi:uncharacterized protein
MPPEASAARPDLARLLEAIVPGSPLARSPLHGEAHWRAVAAVGARLADSVGCPPLLVFLFALFHDCRRENEDRDPEHGARGAALARELNDSLLGLSEQGLGLLEEACRDHTRGRVARDPAVGACWDADRLCLGRLGIEPDPRRVSIRAASEPGMVELAAALSEAPPSWEELWRNLR